jgi:hypothetical protein
MSTIYYKKDGDPHLEPVSEGNPFPVQQFYEPTQSFGARKFPLNADWGTALIFGGYAFLAGDADQNDVVTGQTSFASTTPTFMLRNPAGSDKVIFPPYFNLTQSGSVAGGDITIVTEVDYDAYSTGGTSERVKNQRYGMAGKPTNKGLLYSGATATAGYGIVTGTPATLAPDVSPAEGVINIYEWSNPGGVLLDPGTCLKSFTYAASTGPTWLWGFPWFEIPLSWL